MDEARKIIAKAQELVTKSPVTSAWSVKIIDYSSGSIYYNLNSGRGSLPEHARVS